MHTLTVLIKRKEDMHVAECPEMGRQVRGRPSKRRILIRYGCKNVAKEAA
jgi:hypothetical protein